MNEHQTCLTKRIREAAKKLGTFTAEDLYNPLYIQTYDERNTVRKIIQNLKRSGEIRIIQRGVYEYKTKHKERSKLDIIWHLIRSSWQFDTDEIERLSGAAKATTLKYLHCLKKLGYIRQVRRGHWQFVNDPGPKAPLNTLECIKLRKARINKSDQTLKPNKGPKIEK